MSSELATPYRKKAFGIAGKLLTRFQLAGISEKALWFFLKWTVGIPPQESRKHFTPTHWATVAEKLVACEKSAEMFEITCKEIKAKGHAYIYKVQNGMQSLAYEGLFDENLLNRAQSIADLNGCNVRVFAYDSCEAFVPVPTTARQDTITHMVTETLQTNRQIQNSIESFLKVYQNDYKINVKTLSTALELSEKLAHELANLTQYADEKTN